MGGGVNSSEDERHCSVLYIRKYFVEKTSNYQHTDLCLCITCPLSPCRFNLSLGLNSLPGGQINKGDICLPFPCPFVVEVDS